LYPFQFLVAPGAGFLYPSYFSCQAIVKKIGP
jgi:hypothetical protein